MKHQRDAQGSRSRGLALLVMLLTAPAVVLPFSPAWALSEIKREDLPAPNAPAPTDENPFPGGAVPMPGPIQTPPDESGGSEEATPSEGDEIADDAALPEIIYDLGRLPEPARRMHSLIIEACRSGDIDALRPLLGTGDGGTQLSFGGAQDDPIAFLKDVSGDDEGHEILAILQEVLSAGFVHLDAGTPSELYVWPYFFAVPLEGLTAPQRVELFTIVTAGDYEDMKTYGAYIFYRVGITPEGRWAFFVAGD